MTRFDPRPPSMRSATVSAAHTPTGMASTINAHRTIRFEKNAIMRSVLPDAGPASLAAMAVTIYGVFAVTFMMCMYALEGRGRAYVLGFALGCLLSSAYGFLSGAWPFGVVELIWAGVALKRYRETPAVA